MQERILDTNTLPEFIFGVIKSERFVAREINGGVLVLPVEETMSAPINADRMGRLERLEAALYASSDEDFYIPPRSNEMRPPHGLTD